MDTGPGSRQHHGRGRAARGGYARLGRRRPDSPASRRTSDGGGLMARTARPPEDAVRILDEARRKKTPTTYTGNELRDKVFPPVRWAIPGILAEGVTLFGGREKMGKSWLAFGLCIAVATGGYALGKMPVEQGDALYLSLEDPERRLHKRIRRLADDDADLSRLHIATEWEPADRGGVEQLDGWLGENPECRL